MAKVVGWGFPLHLTSPASHRVLSFLSVVTCLGQLVMTILAVSSWVSILSQQQQQQVMEFIFLLLTRKHGSASADNSRVQI